MECENCSSVHDGTYASGRFCGQKCSRSFATKTKRKDINAKVSLKLTKEPYALACPQCKQRFSSKSRTKKFCSRVCSAKFYGADEHRKVHLRQTQLDLVASGQHKGWASRKNKEPSYPEQFFINVLSKNNIQFEREHKEGSYFIDFALSGKVALEIDGRQHLQAERKAHDKKKDEFLCSCGWKVYRILWDNPVSSSKKEYMRIEIDKLLKFLGMG